MEITSLMYLMLYLTIFAIVFAILDYVYTVHIKKTPEETKEFEEMQSDQKDYDLYIGKNFLYRESSPQMHSKKIYEDVYTELKTEPIIEPKPEKKAKITYTGPKYSKVSLKDIKEYLNNDTPTEEEIHEALTEISRTNKAEGISPYTILLTISMKKLGERIGFKSAGPISAYFNQHAISKPSERKINQYLKENLVNKRIN